MPRSDPDLRILQIVKGLDIGSLHGGAERFAIELSRELKRRGVDVSVCAFFRTGTQSEKKWLDWLAAAEIPCFSAADWSGANEFRSYFTGIRALHKAVENHPVDICHSHFQLGTIGALWLKSSGLTRRVVRTCHVTQEWETGLYGWLREQIFSNWAYPLFLDAEVGVSREITKMINSYWGERAFHRKAVHINNAIPSEKSLATAPIPLVDKADGVKIIGTVGRLSEVKGYRYLLEAGQILRNTQLNFQIWIIGDGELREELEAQSNRLGLRDYVRFFGQREDALALMANLDLFVLTSLREGLPTVILESFSQGVPVVATNVSGIRELVEPGKTGWLVPPADPQALASAVLNALQDKTSLTNFSQAGKEAAKQFTIETTAAKYLALYEHILA